jgi:hypothetical protein
MVKSAEEEFLATLDILEAEIVGVHLFLDF